jgi:hypothetical protein
MKGIVIDMLGQVSVLAVFNSAAIRRYRYVSRERNVLG